jgi:hypothetical protein
MDLAREGDTALPFSRRNFETESQEMELLSEMAVIAWVRRKEKMKARQAEKLVKAEERKVAGGRMADSWRRESKRVGGGVRVKDAVAMVKMEAEVERLAVREAEAEAKARKRNKRKIRRKAWTIIMVNTFEEGLERAGRKAKTKSKAHKRKHWILMQRQNAREMAEEMEREKAQAGGKTSTTSNVKCRSRSKTKRRSKSKKMQANT